MVKKSDKNLIVSLDIGTSKVAAMVGEVRDDGELEVIGVGSHPSRGLKKGVVVNIDSTVQAIQRAVEEAALMADCDVQSVCTDISGSHIECINSHGAVPIRDREVSAYDVRRVLDAAEARAIPSDQKILATRLQEYIIDSQEGIGDPVGMSGVRLEARVHMVTGAESAAQNIERCVHRCGLQVDDMVPGPLASSEAVLSQDEKDLGVCLVDIGGGTTDIAVFTGGAVRYTSVIPVAGELVTNDIAVALRTPTQSAEAIKVKYACAMTVLAGPEETVEVPSIGERAPRRLARRELAEVAEARIEELLSLVQSQLRRSSFEDQIAAGVVLTGGTAKMEGVVELAEATFQTPVRLGVPQHVTGLPEVVRNPAYATGVGLLLFARDQREGRGPELAARGGPRGAWERLRGWLQGNF